VAAESHSAMGLKERNDSIYRVVTSLYRRIGNEKTTAYFQRLALKYRISNNLSQDMKNSQNRQIVENDKGITNFFFVFYKIIFSRIGNSP